jgi:hypothetical protein
MQYETVFYIANFFDLYTSQRVPAEIVAYGYSESVPKLASSLDLSLTWLFFIFRTTFQERNTTYELFTSM